MTDLPHDDDPPGEAWLLDLFRRRAERFASGGAGREGATPRPRALVFSLAGEAYALPLGQLAELLPAPEVTPVPGWPAAILGVANRRGSIHPVADLRRLLGLAPRPPGTGGYLLFLREPADAPGLAVDDATDIRAYDPAASLPPGPVPSSPLVAGLLPDGTLLLDATRLPPGPLAGQDLP